MEIQIRSRTRPVWIVLLILLGLALLDDFSGWRFLLISLAGALLIARLWINVLADGLRLEREMRFGWAQVGDLLEERFTLINTAPVPALWVEIEDHSTLPDYRPGMVTGIDEGGRNAWRIDGMCTRRGLFNLGPTTLRTGDPLGLYTLELHDPGMVQIMVTPPVVPLPHIEVAPGGRAGQGRPRPNAPERTVSAGGVREWIPGDALRWMHWPTTARREKPYVRTFESTPSGDWWLIVDANRAVQAGEGRKGTLEQAVILAASLADRGLRSNRAVGLASNGGQSVDLLRTPAGPSLSARLSPAAGSAGLTWLAPREGDAQRWAILRALAILETSDRPLAELLTGLEPSLGGQASLVLLTSDVGGGWLEALLPLMWKGAIPTVLLLDPAAYSVEGPTDDRSPGQFTAESAGSGRHGPALADTLHRRGIPCQVITPEMLDVPEAQPGAGGRWEWRISATGKALKIHSPHDLTWKRL